MDSINEEELSGMTADKQPIPINEEESQNMTDEELNKFANFGEFIQDAKITPEEFSKMIKDGNYKIAKNLFDFDKIFNFCQEHRVEVMVQDDTMYHCYIDYHTDAGKKGVWAVDMDGFSSMIIGISSYIKNNGQF